MKAAQTRKAVFAGQFYPARADQIKQQIKSFLKLQTPKSDYLGCLLPHAGYLYSGKVATETAQTINFKEKIILLGPNHTGLGNSFSIITRGSWQTPLGDIQIDEDLAGKLLQASEYLEEDALAQSEEHSIEVELPIIQYFKDNFSIVPIAIMSAETAILKKLGIQIAQAILDAKLTDKITLVTSSDMTHYEPADIARVKDNSAIEALLELDIDKLAQRVDTKNITMCGIAPAITMLSALKHLGCKKTKLIAYQNSGDATGDYSSVVGYAGIVFAK